MIKNAVSKAMAVGRFASAVFGLALVLGLMFGVATMALGANGSNFILGSINNTATALTRLTGDVQGPAMQVINSNSGTDDAALALTVQRGEAPMRVNSTGRVANLNADRIDGQSLSCPGGTLFHEGVCIETTKREPVDFSGAEAICLSEGKRLPSVAELQTFRNRPGTDFTVAELSNALFTTDTATYETVVSGVFGNEGFLTWNHEVNYRCVVPAS